MGARSVTRLGGGWRGRRLRRRRPMMRAIASTLESLPEEPGSVERSAGVSADAAGFGGAQDGASVWRESASEGGGLCRWLGRGDCGRGAVQGKELSYNNLVDLDACWALASEFDSTAVAIIKHTNPCGVGQGATVLEAYQRALEADPVSAFGGVIGINRTVDAAGGEWRLRSCLWRRLWRRSLRRRRWRPSRRRRILRLLRIKPAQRRSAC